MFGNPVWSEMLLLRTDPNYKDLSNSCELLMFEGQLLKEKCGAKRSNVLRNLPLFVLGPEESICIIKM